MRGKEEDMDDQSRYPEVPLLEDSGNYSANPGQSQNPGQGYGAPYGSAAQGQGYGTAGAYSANGQSQGYGAPNNGYGPSGAYSTNNAGNGQYAYGYTPDGNNYGPVNDRETQNNPGQAVSVVSLVFGILSVICCWTIILPFIFGTVAVICGIVGAVKHQKKVLWIIGLITGVLGIVLTIIVLASCLPIIYALMEEMDRLGGTLTPQDIQRILREYGIEVNISARLAGFIR